MDNERILVKLRQYKKLLAQQMQVQQLILFGSWARGSARAESDIDVAVVVDGIKGDFFSTRPLLWKVRRQVDDRIEPVLLDKSRDDSGFLDEIMEHGIIIT